MAYDEIRATMTGGQEKGNATILYARITRDSVLV